MSLREIMFPATQTTGLFLIIWTNIGIYTYYQKFWHMSMNEAHTNFLWF